MNINKKIKILDFKLSKMLNWWLFWLYKSKFTWNWIEFWEHKDYVFWDQVKDIDWNSSSKTNNILVKKYEEERDLKVLFVLDNSISMEFWSQDKTKKDLLEKIFYSLAISAYYNNDSIWWIIFNESELEYISHKKSRDNIYKIINILENNNRKKSSKKNKLENVLNYLMNRWIKNNLVFILTDETEKIDKKLLKIVWEKNDIVFINIFDVFENNLMDNTWDISFNFWLKYLNIWLDKDKVSDYKKYRKTKISLLKEFFNKNNIWYIDIDTNSDILHKLLLYFNKVKS